jgi:predicted TPR repeat methyltransferase
MSQSPELWRATYEAETPEALNHAYKKWARLYDRDTVDHMGYVGPDVASNLLDNYLDSRKARVLDAGCGTGLVGEVLKDMGYARVDAMDYSPDMLKVAEEKDVYGKVFQADMNEPLTIPDNAYDATICVGTFTYAHVGPEAFQELTRITKPDGVICFTIRDGAYQEYGYRRKMLELEAADAWELQQMLEEDYLVHENVVARFCAYKVLEA